MQLLWILGQKKAVRLARLQDGVFGIGRETRRTPTQAVVVKAIEEILGLGPIALNPDPIIERQKLLLVALWTAGCCSRMSRLHLIY